MINTHIFPTVKCLHPKKFFKNGKQMVVACGKCEACMLRKSNSTTTLLRMLSQDYKYCHFVTLTYDEQNIPNYSLVSDYLPECDTRRMLLKDECQRSKTFGEIVSFDLPIVEEDADTILTHIKRGDKIGYALKEDVQRFMKRFRINIKRHTTYEDKDIKYYLVSEYGPLHFRPHFHILFWHNEYWDTKIISEIIYKSWPFGNIDCQLSRGHASEYCVSYLNSYVNLPRLYQIRALKPFSLHSQGIFDTREMGKVRKEVYERGAVGRLMYIYTDKNGRTQSAVYPLQVTNRVFPRLPFFRSLTHVQKCRIYRAVYELSTYGDGLSLYKKAGRLTEYFFNKYIHDKDVDNVPCFDRFLNTLATLPSFSMLYPKWTRATLDPTIEGLAPIMSFLSFAYNILRTSTYAMYLCKHLHISVDTLVREIDNYFDKVDQIRLSEFYSTLENENPKNYVHYYSNTLFTKENPFLDDKLKRLYQECFIKTRERLKHKTLNDKFQIINYNRQWQI